MTINERMFTIMDQKKIQAIDIANHLGTSKSVISNWKKRGTNPPAEYIIPICELLGVSIEHLLTGNENLIGLTEHEEKIVKAYRKADNRTKEIIRLSLEPYMTKEKSYNLMNG